MIKVDLNSDTDLQLWENQMTVDLNAYKNKFVSQSIKWKTLRDEKTWEGINSSVSNYCTGGKPANLVEDTNSEVCSWSVYYPADGDRSNDKFMDYRVLYSNGRYLFQTKAVS